MQKLQIEEIEEMILGKKIPQEIIPVVELFLAAINDWPTDVCSFFEYVHEVESFIGGVSTKEGIENALRSVDLLENAWESESLSQIIEVFHFYPNGISLVEISNSLG